MEMDELLDMQEECDFRDYEDCVWVENLGVFFQAMQQSSVLTDMKLRAEDTEFPCHRILLAARSPVFRAMLTGPMKEESKTTFDIPGKRSSTRLLLDFMYTGKLRITEENVRDVLVPANYLQLHKLIDVCSDFLQRQLDFENCFEMYTFAKANDCEELLRATQRYILKNFPEVSSSRAFLEAGFEQLHSLLGQDNLYVLSEMDLYRSIITWVSQYLQARRCYLADLLRLVRLPYLPMDSLNVISRDTSIAACPSCRTVLHDAQLCKEDAIPYPVEWESPRSSTYQVEVLAVLGGLQRNENVSLYHYCCDPRSRPLTWTTYSQSLMPFLFCGTKMYEVTKFQNAIYITGGTFGGVPRSAVWRYEISEDQSWIRVKAPSLLTVRYHHGSAVAGGHLFVAGGYDGHKTLSSVECYNPDREKWELSPPMPEAVTFPAAVGYHNRLFVIGGMKGDLCVYPWMQCYDVMDKSWSVIKTLELNTVGSKSVLLNDAIYIVGGQSCDVYRYDPKNDVAFDVDPTKDIHYLAGVTVCNGEIYVAGGQSYEKPQDLDSIECDDPDSSECDDPDSIECDDPDSSKRYYPDSIECYDPDTKTWSIIGKMAVPLYYNGMVSIVRPNIPRVDLPDN